MKRPNAKKLLGLGGVMPGSGPVHSVVRFGTYLAIVLGVFTLTMWATDVVPWCRDAHEAWCWRMTVGTLMLASLAAVFRGIVRAKQPPLETARWKRIVVRVVFWLWIPLGVAALSEGHVYHVKAKQLNAQQQEILARTGYYHNPYWERQTICDFVGIACFGSWALWTWLALVAAASESVTWRVVRRQKDSSGRVGVSVRLIVKIALALVGLGIILFMCWWSRGFS